MPSPHAGLYHQIQFFDATLRGQTIRVYTKPGLPGWREVSAGGLLLAEQVELTSGEQVLHIGCGHGAVSAVLARLVSKGLVWAVDMTLPAVQMTQLTLENNGLTNARVSGEAGVEATRFDAAVIELPKGRKVARRWLLLAGQRVKAGGTIYLAGANDEGVQSVAKDAQELFGPASVLGYRKGSRCMRLARPATLALPAWSEEPGVMPGSWIEWEQESGGFSFRLYSLPGVFSYNELDEGTALLLDTVQAPHERAVLDFGCGYGIIGLWAARKGAAHVDLIDANLPAVEAARRNLEANGISQAEVLPSDIFSAVQGRQYDLILSNPPFHTGKAVDYDVTQAFITKAPEMLKQEGRLVIVANRFIRYDTLIEKVFGACNVLSTTGKFMVMEGVKVHGRTHRSHARS